MPHPPQYGIEGQQAPEWDVAQWFNLPQGEQALSMRDVAHRTLHLYCFQSWCPARQPLAAARRLELLRNCEEGLPVPQRYQGASDCHRRHQHEHHHDLVAHRRER